MRTTLASGRSVELARPSDGRTPTRGLVLLPDIMDLRPLFDAHSQRLADEQGWAVANVEIWHGHQELDLAARMESVGLLDDGALLADLVAAADLLDVEPVGVAGFCMGGMYALKAAGTGGHVAGGPAGLGWHADGRAGPGRRRGRRRRHRL